MPAPVLSPPAALLVDYLDPWMVDDAANGSPYAWIASAAGGMFTDIWTIVRDQEDGTPGLKRAFDPDVAEAWVLPWLAVVAGLRLDPNLPVTAQRALIHPDANKRGTPAAIIAAVQATLAPTSNKNVQLIPRTDGPFRHTLITYEAETPDPALTEAVLNSRTVKPMNEWFTYEVVPGWSIDEMEAEYDGLTLVDLEADFADLDALERRLPS